MVSIPDYAIRSILIASISLLAGCYSLRIGSSTDLRLQSSAPAQVEAFFAQQPEGCLVLSASNPGREYAFDPGEKDRQYSREDGALRFRKIDMELRERMPEGRILVDIRFEDEIGTELMIEAVDLMRLIPRLETTGAMQMPEFLLEEFGRFGVKFRREHGEFDLAAPKTADAPARDAIARAYRVGLWNNCLDPTKWEMVLHAEDYSDFGERLDLDLNLNQSRTLSHSWFQLPEKLYSLLLGIKNKGHSIDMELKQEFAYDALSKRASEVVIDFDSLRSIKRIEETEVIELGHRSGRALEAVIKEQYYKWDLGLVVNREAFPTYASVLDTPVKLAAFQGCGYYKPEEPKVFDFAWLGKVEQIELATVDVPGSECYVQLTLTGENAPYTVTLGNIDLAHIDEQHTAGMLFGVNTYPKTRRHNPKQDTIRYEPDHMPANILPFLLMTDTKSGRWVNNQEKGIEKVLLTWESIERDVLIIHLLTYERMMPVWMGRVRLPDSMVDRIRVRRRLYTY